VRIAWLHRGLNKFATQLMAGTLCLALAVTDAPCSFAQSDRPYPVTTRMSDKRFVPGQVWSFKSREFEPDPTLTILKIESLSKIGEIIHIRVDGIRLRNCTGGPEPTNIGHAPFTRDAIERSVGKLIRTGAVPAFEDGYGSWKENCGGVYTILVGEMIAVDEKTYNSQFGCSVLGGICIRD